LAIVEEPWSRPSDTAILRQNLANIHIAQGQCAQGASDEAGSGRDREKTGRTHPDVIGCAAISSPLSAVRGSSRRPKPCLSRSSFDGVLVWPAALYLVPLLVSDAQIHREKSQFRSG
jgi:hypothetical protein